MKWTQGLTPFLTFLIVIQSTFCPLATAALPADDSPFTGSSDLMGAPSDLARPDQESWDRFISFKKDVVSLPSTLVEPIQTFSPVNPSRFVYQFQDIHAHLDSQINLAESISFLATAARKQNKKLVVGVEGQSEEIDTDFISQTSDQVRREKVAAGLLRSGFLFGEEYAALVQDPGRVEIIGLEDRGLYLKNKQVAEESEEFRENVLSFVAQLEKQLEILSDRLLSPALIQLEKNRKKFQSGDLSISDYVRYLGKTNPMTAQSYSAVADYLTLMQQESKIDFNEVNSERRARINQLMRIKNQTEAQKAINEAVDFREGRLSALHYYSSLLGQAGVSYPALKRYVDYLDNVEKINMDRLYDEISSLETQLSRQFLTHEASAQMYEHRRWLENESHFLALSLLPEEWAVRTSNTHWKDSMMAFTNIQTFINEQASSAGMQFNTLPFEASNLKKAWEGANDFYLMAEKRNKVFVKNLEEILDEHNDEKFMVAIVLGGFHTPGVSRLIQSRNWATSVYRSRAQVEVSFPEGFLYPPFPREYVGVPDLHRGNFLRPQGGLGLKGAIDFIVRLLTKNPEFPRSGWPGNQPSSMVKFSPKTRQVLRRAWSTVAASFPILNLWVPSPSPRSDISVAAPSIISAIGQQADQFQLQLDHILKMSPSLVEDSRVIAIDVDSFASVGLFRDQEKFVRLFKSLSERAYDAVNSQAKVVFFSVNQSAARKTALQKLVATLNAPQNKIAFSFVMTPGIDSSVEAALLSAGVSKENITPQNAVVFSMNAVNSETASTLSAVQLQGLPHLALATFAYTHFKEASPVLSRLVTLFERLTPLKMNGTLADTILADVLAKISA